MGRRNPYRRVVRWLSAAGYSILSVLGFAGLGLVVVALWDDMGAWALAAVPGAILGIILLSALLVGTEVAVRQWWWRREIAWDRREGELA